jgi:hypothetical protein
LTHWKPANPVRKESKLPGAKSPGKSRKNPDRTGIMRPGSVMLRCRCRPAGAANCQGRCWNDAPGARHRIRALCQYRFGRPVGATPHVRHASDVAEDGSRASRPGFEIGMGHTCMEHPECGDTLGVKHAGCKAGRESMSCGRQCRSRGADITLANGCAGEGHAGEHRTDGRHDVGTMPDADCFLPQGAR